jgi:6-phosphogluconolactonase (cycloisomerase 2 family)
MIACSSGAGSNSAANTSPGNPNNPGNPGNPGNPNHPSVTIGGTVSGLATGMQVSLENNTADVITVGNGVFTFPKQVVYNGDYSVVVKNQPAGYICSVSNGAGTQVTTNVSNISVTCNQLGYFISGTVSGLPAGKQLTLLNNNADPIAINANGTFTFAKRVAKGSSYTVTISQPPLGWNCSIDNNIGYDLDADIANVRVVCSSSKFSLSGLVTGLAASKQLTLQINQANPVTVSQNGPVTLSSQIASGSNYTVSVQSQPEDQVCSVINHSLNSGFTSVSNVKVICSNTSFSIGGSVVGLAAGASLTILNNNADPLTITANGSFSFSTPVASDGNYSVTINKQPKGQVCSVSNYAGKHLAAPVNNVSIVCNKTGYTISGTITGLNSLTPSGPTALIARLLNNDGDPLIVNSDGSFTFATPIAPHQGYVVTLQAQPLNKMCVVTNGSGNDVTSNVTNVQVNCSAYTGSLTALTPLSVAFPGQGLAYGIAVTPDGKYLYATGSDATSFTVNQYSIGNNGLLSLLTPTAANSGPDPFAIAITPNGKFAYVINQRGQSITQFSIAANGKLTALSSTAISLPAQPLDIMIAPNGKYAYVTLWSTNSILQYAISNTGQLVPLTPNRIGSGSYNRLAITPDNQFVYASYSDNDCVSQFKVESDGRLTEFGSCIVTGDHPNDIAISVDQRYLFVANANGKSISRFAIKGDGTLVPLGTTTTGAIQPDDLVITPDGRFLYATSASTLVIRGFAIGFDGSLANFETDFSVPVRMYRGVVVPNGQYLYFAGGDVYQYRLY